MKTTLLYGRLASVKASSDFHVGFVYYEACGCLSKTVVS